MIFITFPRCISVLVAGHYSGPPRVANAETGKGVLHQKGSGSSSDRWKTDVADPLKDRIHHIQRQL